MYILLNTSNTQILHFYQSKLESKQLKKIVIMIETNLKLKKN